MVNSSRADRRNRADARLVAVDGRQIGKAIGGDHAQRQLANLGRVNRFRLRLIHVAILTQQLGVAQQAEIIGSLLLSVALVSRR